MDDCEINGCDEAARYIDPWDNRLCESCMQKDAEENNLEWDDYEYIPKQKNEF